ncbi:serine/arginine repetitive matrix protein 1-like [Achroia grisella]|uniref:serine/arginine repetitive matrix protein 1-like n=1 Tax=Achroia grisella TaxID=688607 RepID=UPI0027D28B69|nr:serine/arginine repetitive matrix protein 1-like [Achroia grisella]
MSQRGKAPRKPPDRGAPRTVVRRDLRNPTKLVPATELGTFHARPASKGTPSALAGSGNDAADREPGRGERCAQPGPSKRRAPPSPTSPARGDKRRDVEESPPRDLDLVKVPPTPRIRLVDKGYQPLPSQSGTVRRKPSPPPRSPSPRRIAGARREGKTGVFTVTHARRRHQRRRPRHREHPRHYPVPTHWIGVDMTPLLMWHSRRFHNRPSRCSPVPSPRRRTPPSFAAVAAGPATAAPATPAPATSIAPALAPPLPSQTRNADAERLPNWTRHFDQLRRVLGEAPNARPYGTGVRFLPRTDEEFRAVQRYLVEASEKDPTISWYFYSLASELPTKVAIRGLPADTPNDKIAEALQEKGFGVRLVRGIPARRGRPGCIFHAQLDPMDRDELTRLYATDELLYMRGVVVEAWKPASVLPQCHRCQAFGHASANCHRPVKCVRCGGEHPAANCDRPRDQKPTCANCAKAHTANDRKCPVYKREARQRGIKPRPPVPTATTKTPVAQTQRRNKPTAAPRTYVAQAPPPVITVEETAGANLMAPANEPKHRGTDTGENKRRRRRRRGKKRRGDGPVTASTPIPFLPIPPLQAMRTSHPLGPSHVCRPNTGSTSCATSPPGGATGT